MFHARVIPLSTILLVLALCALGCAPSAPAAPTAAPTTAPAAPTTAPAATATSAPAAAALQPCGSGTLAMSPLQTPVPVTPLPTLVPTIAPTRDPNAPTSPPPAPTATPRPAPTVDRVGYPEDYLNKFKLMYVFDRGGNEQVRVICANDAATAWKQGQPLPYGSVLVMETWRAKREASGAVVKDSNGHFVREALTGIFVMRKEPGFGTDYKELRTGEWEYVAFRPGPDKQYSTPPQGTFTCAACHIGGSNNEKDWTFRAPLFFTKDHYAQVAQPGKDEVVVSSMGFGPSALTVKPGTTVKWRFDDVTVHTVTANDKSFDSSTRASPSEFTFKFDKAGTFAYVCTLHPEQMRGTITVKE